MNNNEPASVEVSDRKGFREVTLRRPERKNAINIAMYSAMTDAIREAQAEKNIRAILLTGSEGNFTSGNDLEDFARHGMADLNSDHPILNFMRTLATCTKPIAVAVEGVAVGIGTTLLLHVDLAYANPQATFKLPFVSLGLCPEFASSWLMPRQMGHVKAAEYLLLGEEFGAPQAEKLGLINGVENDPLATARQRCAKLAQLPPAAVRTAKRLLKQPVQSSVDQVISEEAKEFSIALQGPEFAEAVAAFFEKRAADFSHFE